MNTHAPNGNTGNRQEPEQLAYSYPQAAALLGVCGKTLFNEAKAGRLKVAKVGRRTIIPAAEIQRWLSASTSKSINTMA